MVAPPENTTSEQGSVRMSASYFAVDWKSRRGLRSPPCRPSSTGIILPARTLHIICYNVT
eukprot:8822603-Lingulodinium_polyedra.AAC.1